MLPVVADNHDRFGVDLSEGTAHEALGLVMFMLVFLALVSTDRILMFLLEPIDVGQLYRADIDYNPLIATWNPLFAFLGIVAAF